MNNRALLSFLLLFVSIAIGTLSAFEFYYLLPSADSSSHYASVLGMINGVLIPIFILALAFGVYSFSKNILTSKNGVQVTPFTVKSTAFAFVAITLTQILAFTEQLLLRLKVLPSYYADGITIEWVVISVLSILILGFISYKIIKLGKGFSVNLKETKERLPATNTSRALGLILIILLFVPALGFLWLGIKTATNDFGELKTFTDEAGSFLYTQEILPYKIIYSLMFLGAGILSFALLVAAGRFLFNSNLLLSKKTTIIAGIGALLLAIGSLLYAVVNVLLFLTPLNWYWNGRELQSSLLSLLLVPIMLIAAKIAFNLRNGYSAQIKLA